MCRWFVGMAGICALTACNQIFGIPNATQGEPEQPEYFVSGVVRGLWDGTDGIELRLQADGVDALVTVPANGAFQFDAPLRSGASYTVSVGVDQDQDGCTAESGGNGQIADSDITTVSIACTGPAMSVAFTGLWGWSFDATQSRQIFSGSIALQDVALTIDSTELTGARVDDTELPLGVRTRPIALPLGPTSIALSVTASGGLSKTYELVFDRGSVVLEQAVYGKASNTQGGDEFGVSVSLSGDTIAVGAPGECSIATGVNGNDSDNTLERSGAVYVFVRNGATWNQQAYLKASNTGDHDEFGRTVSLFGDTLAVAAPNENSNATGVNGNQDGSLEDAGAVYVFVRHRGVWTQQAYVKASNTEERDVFGSSVSLFENTLAVGAIGESGGTRGVNGNQASNTALGSGAVYVFNRSGTVWSQQAYVKASNTGVGDSFGWSVSLWGQTLAVGAPFESSSATGVNGDQNRAGAEGAGAAYVFVRNGTAWAQQAYIKASNTELSDGFGSSISLHGDTLAVGAINEASGATGIDGDQSSNTTARAGAVYVFTRSGATWSHQAYLKASNTGMFDEFGTWLSVSGNLLAVGAPREGSRATGVNGNEADNSASGSGAVYLFARDGSTWRQRAYVKASNTRRGALFAAVSLSNDTLAVGSSNETSAATGINGDQADQSAPTAGAFYAFR